MKKIILGITAILLTITLSACGASSNDAAITNLGNQLDETANTITSFKMINPNDISISTEKASTLLNENSNAMISNSQQAQFSLLNEQYYKTDILRQTARLKSGLSKNLKLSKAQISAIKDYTNNLGKYTNSIAYTESEMENTAKSVGVLKKNITKNVEKINAKLSRLTCNSNARLTYFENILYTLDELENCLNLNFNQNESQIPPIVIDTPSNDDNKNNTTDSTAQTQTINDKNKLKNIDTYITYPNDSSTKNTKDCKLCEKNNQNTQTKNQSYPINQEVSESGKYYRYINPVMSRDELYINNGGQFNPARNTDTYAPMVRNIDTYGINNGVGYGMSTPFGTNRMYGGNGIYNGMYGNRFYGNGYGYNYGFNQMNGPYGAYNSNNINRMTMPYQYPAVAPVNGDNSDADTSEYDINSPKMSKTESQVKPEQRLEDYEILNSENTIEKSAETKNSQTNKNTNMSSMIQENKNNSTINENQLISLSEIELHKTPQTRMVDAKKIQEQKTQTEIEDELNKTVVAH